MLRTTLCAALVLLAASPARAQIFDETWESGSARWHATDGGITLTSDTTDCSSTFQHETRLYSGGRVWLNSPVAIDGGPACLAVWIRGSAGTQPFIGVNHAFPDGGFYPDGGTSSSEHWLIGHLGYATGYFAGDFVTPVASDGAWHWYTKSFTPGAGVPALIIKDELFQGGSAGSADFDDIQLYAGTCPLAPQGTASHAVCSGFTPICSSAGQCVQCTADTDCSSPTPFCQSSTCVACRSNADCSGSTPICDATAHACRPCLTNNDCSGSTSVCVGSGPNAGTCVACTSDATCSAPTPRCDTGTDTCVGCLTSADCSGATPVCDANTCRGCLSDGDCGGTTPACQPSGACGQCSGSNPSACGGTTPVCDADAGSCAGCSGDSDCGGTTPACQPSGACGQCSSSNSGQCGAGQLCDADGGVCVSCLTDANCAPIDACHTASCDPSSLTCVQTLKGDGAACSDGSACTSGETCTAGVCGNPTSTVSCSALDECHTAGTCEALTGACTNPTQPDGTPCSLGTCQAGVCTAPTTTTTSTSSGSGSGSTSSSSTSTSGSGSSSGSTSTGTTGTASSTSTSTGSGTSGASSSGSASGSTGGSAGAGGSSGTPAGGIRGSLAGGGCGCGTSGSDASVLLLAFGALALVRRRRR